MVFWTGQVCFYFLVRKVRLTAARKLNRQLNRGRTENDGGGDKGRRPLFESWIYYSHESANTHNVNTGDKSIWYIFLYTENIFYVYFTNQTNWITIYTWPYYLLVCKLFIFFFSCLRTTHFSFLAFANNFFPDFSSPLPKNNGWSLKTIYIAKWPHWR